MRGGRADVAPSYPRPPKSRPRPDSAPEAVQWEAMSDRELDLRRLRAYALAMDSERKLRLARRKVGKLQDERREAIRELVRCGDAPTYIAWGTGIPISTIYDATRDLRDQYGRTVEEGWGSNQQTGTEIHKPAGESTSQTGR